MTNRSRSKFHIALSNLVEKYCEDEDALLVFKVFLEKKDPLTLDELAGYVFDEGIPEDDEFFVLVYEEKHNKTYRDAHILNGIAELQDFAVPILKSEDGKFSLGNSVGDIWKMVSSFEEEIKQLNGTLNAMHMNVGRLLEMHYGEDFEDE